jgi:succinylglutamate desuccinylase
LKSRNALVVINFYDAHQTLRNSFAKFLQLEQWTRFPSVPNAYCTTYLSDAPDEALVEQAEADLTSAAIAVGIEEWDACCFLEECRREVTSRASKISS